MRCKHKYILKLFIFLIFRRTHCLGRMCLFLRLKVNVVLLTIRIILDI